MANPNRILSLDIGASSLKLAEFQSDRSGGLELVRYAVESLGLDPQDDSDRSRYIVTTLREMLQEHGIRPGPVVVSVSGQSVFSRFVKLPPVEPEKVEQIVQYEAQQNVPFPMNEVVWDYQLVGGAEGEVDVMLAAIKGEIIEEMTDCVTFAGLKPVLVDVAPMALYNAVRYNYDDLPGCTLVIDIGARSTDLVFMEEGRVFSRSIPVAGNTITQQIMREFDLDFNDAEDLKRAHAFVAFGGAYEAPSSEVADKVSKSVRSVMTRMHAEISRSINFYRSQQSGSQPELVLIAGGTSVIPYADTFLKEKLKVEVSYLNPFLNVAVNDRISAEQIGDEAHLLGEVVGLALRRVLTCPIELNLMPPKIVAQAEFERKQPLILAAMVGLVLVVAIWCGYFFKMTSLANRQLVQVENQVEKLERLERQLIQPEQRISEIEDNIQVLRELIGERTQWATILASIREVLPEGMWLTSVEPQAAEVEEEEAEDRRRNVRRRREPATASRQDSVLPESIPRIEIAGLGYTDKIPSARPIREFRDALRAQTNLFTAETEITWQPQPSPDEFVREFRIMTVLKEPLER